MELQNKITERKNGGRKAASKSVLLSTVQYKHVGIEFCSAQQGRIEIESISLCRFSGRRNFCSNTGMVMHLRSHKSRQVFLPARGARPTKSVKTDKTQALSHDHCVLFLYKTRGNCTKKGSLFFDFKENCLCFVNNALNAAIAVLKRFELKMLLVVFLKRDLVLKWKKNIPQPLFERADLHNVHATRKFFSVSKQDLSFIDFLFRLAALAVCCHEKLLSQVGAAGCTRM